MDGEQAGIIDRTGGPEYRRCKRRRRDWPMDVQGFARNSETATDLQQRRTIFPIPAPVLRWRGMVAERVGVERRK
jgi:hypothetical protein